MDLFYQAIFFSVPSWISNIIFTLIVPLKKKFPVLFKNDGPIDGGLSLWGNRVFGNSRTLSGLFLSVIFGFLFLFIYGSWLVFLQTVFTFFGTLLGSFVKRRIGLDQGEALVIWDQADYMFLILPIWVLFFNLNIYIALVSFVLTVIGQPLISFIGFKFNLKSRPY